MCNCRKIVDGYECWLMKVFSIGVVVFNDIESVGGVGGCVRGGEDGENGELD